MRALLALLLLTSIARAEVPALTPPPGARLMIGLEAQLGGVAVSPTGAVLAVVSAKDGLQLVDVVTARGIAARADLVCKEKPRDSPPCDPEMAFSPDGKRLALWWPALDKLVVVAIPSAKTVFQAKVENLVARLVFLADGRLLADGLYGARGEKTAFAHPQYITGVSPDGKRFVKSDQVIDASSKLISKAPTTATIMDLSFGSDPDLFVASKGTGYPDIVTWRTGDKDLRTLVSGEKGASTGGDEGVHSFAFPAPYDRVFVAMGRRLLGVTLEGKRVFRSDWITRAQLSPGSVGRTASELVAVAYRCPYRVDAKGDLVLGRIFCAARPGTLAFDEKGDQLVSIPWDGSGLMTFDTKTGALVAARLQSYPFPIGGASVVAVAKDPTLAKKVEQALAKAKLKPGNYSLSPDRTLAFVDGPYGENAIVDLTTGRARKVTEDFVVSGDGKRIAIAHADDEKEIDVRTVDGDRLIRTLPTPTNLIERSMFSYDGSVWAVEGNATVNVLDVATGATLFEAPCRGSYTGHVELSRDGRLLVCEAKGATVIFDVRTKKQVKRIEHPWGSVDTFALSSDGKQLAIGAENIILVDLK